jgi:membrane associated rhomboid family serine protease/Tfp pilus assembly protein PilF
MNLILYIGALPGDRNDLAIRYGLIPERLGPHHLEFVRLFTTNFLHFELAHLIVNMTFLWLFGRKVEKLIGPLEFLLFYIGSGFVAAALHVAIAFAFLPNLMVEPVVGASGSVAGVLGVYAVRFGREKLSFGRFRIGSVYLLLSWLIIQATFGVASIFSTSNCLGPLDLSNVSYWSHIGGFVFGMTAAWLTIKNMKTDEQLSQKRLGEIRKKTLLEVTERFKALCTADPLDPFAHAELARVYALLGNRGQSVEYYLKAIDYYRKDGKRDDALACMQEALRFWPQTGLPHDAVFRFACSLEILGEYAQSENLFTWLADDAKGKPEGEMALLKLAQIQLDRLNDSEKAIQSIQRLMREYPNSRWSDLADQILRRAVTEAGP